jgi:MYXO-CTERM domain-containing protein
MRNWLLCLLLLAPAPALAGRCPAVMILLDVSYSMTDTPSGVGTTPKKIDIAKQAIATLVNKYGSRIPLGFATFSEPTFGGCNQGITIYDEPAVSQSSQLIMDVNAVQPDNGTNTGQAVAKIAADPHLHDTARPTSAIILITDGEPNCPGTGSTEPDYTIQQIKAAAMADVQTFVVGFGKLPTTASMNMDMMAAAGGVPCNDTNCNGHMYYAADSAQSLNDAIDSISTKIVGEFGAQCDDSCYANPCPNGQICVLGACKPDPCAGVGPCAPGDYCYTNGTTPGVCTRPCPVCGAGSTCYMGQCRTDPCATASCVMGQTCVNGQCVNDTCGTKMCDTNLICVAGNCVDDPCAHGYVQCPTGTSCLAGKGYCVATGPGGPTTTRHSSSGCAVGDGDARTAALSLLLLLGAGAVVARRRRHSHGGSK